MGNDNEKLYREFIERLVQYAANRDKQFTDAVYTGDTEHIERSRTAYIYTLSNLAEEGKKLLEKTGSTKDEQ